MADLFSQYDAVHDAKVHSNALLGSSQQIELLPGLICAMGWYDLQDRTVVVSIEATSA